MYSSPTIIVCNSSASEDSMAKLLVVDDTYAPRTSSNYLFELLQGSVVVAAALLPLVALSDAGLFIFSGIQGGHGVDHYRFAQQLLDGLTLIVSHDSDQIVSMQSGRLVRYGESGKGHVRHLNAVLMGVVRLLARSASLLYISYLEG